MSDLPSWQMWDTQKPDYETEGGYRQVTHDEIMQYAYDHGAVDREHLDYEAAAERYAKEHRSEYPVGLTPSDRAVLAIRLHPIIAAAIAGVGRLSSGAVGDFEVDTE